VYSGSFRCLFDAASPFLSSPFLLFLAILAYIRLSRPTLAVDPEKNFYCQPELPGLTNR
jgi:hypothetical protein